MWQYELSALRKRQEEEFLPQVCPIFETRYPKDNKAFTLHFVESEYDNQFKFCSSAEEFTVIVPPNKIYMREKEIMPTLKHHRTIFIWLANSSVSNAIKILDDSVMWCEQAWIEIPFYSIKPFQTININIFRRKSLDFTIWKVGLFSSPQTMLQHKSCSATTMSKSMPELLALK